MARASERSVPTLVVRMFSGWAESVLWRHGPLPYDELDLPAVLVDKLEEWDRVWSEHAEGPGLSGQLCRDHDRQGVRLAGQVADAFGSTVEVVLESGRSQPSRRYRGRGPASSPAALAAVLAVHRAADSAQTRQAAAAADGALLQWSADVPPV